MGKGMSQTCIPANAGPDKTICNSGSVLIGNADDDEYAYSYLWAPITGLSDPRIPQPTASPTSTTMYTVTKTPRNLLINGDFEAGNAGFQTDYLPIPPITHGRYTITNDPNSVYRLWCATADHTINGTLMMLMDGSEDITKRVWYQSVKVLPNTTYSFSGYAYETSPPYVWEPGSCAGSCGNAILVVKINGQIVVNNFEVFFQNCAVNAWVQFQGSWFSGSDVNATVEIYSVSGKRVGNDFALDDLSLTIDCPETTDNVTVTLLTPAQANIESAFADISLGYDPPVQLDINNQNEVCYPWENGVAVTVNAVSGSGNTWYIDDVEVYDLYYSPAIGHVRITNNSKTLEYAPYPTNANRKIQIKQTTGDCVLEGSPLNARFIATFFPDWNWLGFIAKNTWTTINSIDYGSTATYTWNIPGVTVTPVSSNSSTAQMFVPNSYVGVYNANCGCYPVYGHITISNSPYPCSNGTYGIYWQLPAGGRSRDGASVIGSINQRSLTANLAYPNPTKGHTTIKYDEIGEVKSVVVYTSLGQPVNNYNYFVRHQLIDLDLSQLSDGLYMIVVNGVKASKNYKVMIIK